jgi:hypothetical protein
MAVDAPQTAGVRGPLGQVLSEALTAEYLKELLDELKGRTVGAWAFCPDCRKKVQCEVKDINGIIKSVVELIEQVEGRPGSADVGEAGLSLVVERSWPKS